MLITRRDFIKGAAVALLTYRGANALKPVQVENEIVEKTMELMGTTARITIISNNRNRANEAISQAFSRMQRVDKLMSIFRRDSEISLLNKYGYYGGLSPETAEVIRTAIQYSKLSDGAFDISILPILNSNGKIGTEDLTNYRNIILNDRNVKFLKSGMSITLGGIGVGHAVDSAIEVLKNHDIDQGMINIGGDIRTIGDNTDGVSWKIGIEDPEDRRRLITTIDLKDNAVATSGNYQKIHIMNPGNGRYPQGLLSATIIAPRAIDADAVSTTVFVLGIEKGLEFINKQDGIEGLLISEKHRIIRSNGFKNFET